MATIVKKFGGATLETPEKIKAIALSLRESHLKGNKLIVVVSAMGQTTNELIHLAHQVSSRPKSREMDMLLTAGERVSMSLLSMALNDLGCPAISFTGSQAGILTDDSHLSAFITDLNPQRVHEALDKNQIVIIAGFQGVSPKSKEITTLGRGGSDTTAVAIASAMRAGHCEILKDVAGVYSADPRVCSSATAIHELSYQQMLEMTFWGAKVLHYRSVELSLTQNVPIYVGPAHNTLEGTWIKKKDTTMFEALKVISVNSHAEVLQIKINNDSLTTGLQLLQKELQTKEISPPQLLAAESLDQHSHLLYFSGPSEVLAAMKRELIPLKQKYQLSKDDLCCVTATCSGASTPEIATLICQELALEKMSPVRLWMSGMSCSVLLPSTEREMAVLAIHNLTTKTLQRNLFV